MAAVAAMEFNGVPVSQERLKQLRENWTQIQDHLIARIDADYQVFEGRTFKLERFQRWLVHNKLPWPILKSGRLDLSDDAFRQMAKISPSVAPLRELRHALSEMRLNDLAIGHDGRNRCLLSPFGARSGRTRHPTRNTFSGPASGFGT